MAWKVNTEEVGEQVQRWSWEGAQYERGRRHLSVALGNVEGSRHPFDVELTRVPPGAAPCPVHSHSALWEFFLIVAGQGEVSRNGETFAVRPGDCFMQPPGTQHRVRNASATEDLLFYVIANEGGVDVCTKHRP
ncbi:MAG: cupin domain-containing protein [Candidatus Latescibacterota bacterium]